MQRVADYETAIMQSQALYDEKLEYMENLQKDEAKLVEDSVTIVFSVNGKRRSEAKLPVGATKDAMVAAAKADATVQKFIDGKEIIREIVFLIDF